MTRLPLIAMTRPGILSNTYNNMHPEHPELKASSGEPIKSMTAFNQTDNGGIHNPQRYGVVSRQRDTVAMYSNKAMDFGVCNMHSQACVSINIRRPH